MPNGDLATTVRGLSPEALDIFKRELPLRLKSMRPEDRNAVLSRISNIPELGFQPSSEPQRVPTQGEAFADVFRIPEDTNIFLQGLQAITTPFRAAQEFVFTPLVASLSQPAWIREYMSGLSLEERAKIERQNIGERLKSFLPGGELRRGYEEWESPKFVKGLLEIAPWFATGGAIGLASKLSKGGRISQLAAKALTPAVKFERAITYPIAKPLEIAGKKLAPKIAARLQSQKALMSDLQNPDELIQVASNPDRLRQLASIPALAPAAKLLGGMASVAKKPVEWYQVGRRMLIEEGRAKATGVMASLERQGTSSKIFGLTAEGTMSSGVLKGIHINTIRTFPKRYAKNLTPEQNAWVSQAQKIEEAKLSFLKRNGIEINELGFDEGGVYAGRRVVGRVMENGEVVDIAFIGPGGARPGARAAFEKNRVFKDIDEAVKEGYRYLPEEEALTLNVQGAYNRVANRQMADWLLERVPWRTAEIPESLKIAAFAATRNLAKARNLQGAVNRAIRGEKLPEQTIRSLEEAFPEIGLRESLGNVRALKGLRPKVKDIIKKQQAERNLTVSERVKARQRVQRPTFEEAAIPEVPAFAGKILTGPEAREIAQSIRQELNPQFNKALGAVNQANAVGRYFALAGDVSPFTIQMIFLAGAHPTIYAKAMGGFVKAMFDPKFHARYLAEHAGTIQASRNLILTKGGATEFTEAMARGGLLRKGPLKILGKPLTPFQRGFEASLDVAGIEMREAYQYLATTPARAAQVEAFINEFRGLANRTRIGVSSTQRQIERAAILAPQYNVAVAALLVDIVRGNLRGQLARRAMAKGVGAIAAMTVAVSYAIGEDFDEIVEHLKPQSDTFMTWKIAGQNVGPGSKVRSLARLFAQTVNDPENLTLRTMENPGLRFVRGNLAPAVSTGLDLWTGEDYIGDPTRDNLLQFSERVFAKNLLPIWVQSVALEGGDISGRATRGLVEFGGMRGYPMQPYQERDILRNSLAQQAFSMDWNELASPQGPGKLAQRELEQLSPELQELSQKAQEKSSKMALGEGKVWDTWYREGQEVQQIYRDRVSLAVREFRQTQDGTLFREKVDGAADVRREMYARRELKPEYDLIREYFAEPLEEQVKEEMNPRDLARREYFQALFSPDMYDEFNNYNFEEADAREAIFVNKYGQEALDYAQAFEGTKWPEGEPEELQLLRSSKKLLRPYFDIERSIWAEYPPELKRLSQQIEILNRTNPALAKQMLARYPQILWARKLIALSKKQARLTNPDIDFALRTFYRR